MVNTLGRSLFNGKPTGAHRAKVLVVQPVVVSKNILPSLMNEIVAGCPIKTVRTAYVAGKVGCYFQVYGGSRTQSTVYGRAGRVLPLHSSALRNLIPAHCCRQSTHAVALFVTLTISLDAHVMRTQDSFSCCISLTSMAHHQTLGSWRTPGWCIHSKRQITLRSSLSS